MFSNPPRPTTNSDGNSEPPFCQQLMFLPAGQDREKYNPKEYRTLLRKHLNGHSRIAKPSRRKPGTGGAKAHADPAPTRPSRRSWPKAASRGTAS